MFSLRLRLYSKSDVSLFVPLLPGIFLHSLAILAALGFSPQFLQPRRWWVFCCFSFLSESYSSRAHTASTGASLNIKTRRKMEMCSVPITCLTFTSPPVPRMPRQFLYLFRHLQLLFMSMRSTEGPNEFFYAMPLCVFYALSSLSFSYTHTCTYMKTYMYTYVHICSGF